ncbi:MAG TPA: hypothetical protein VHS28_00710, partial [Chloroflexota bacterium]|nr:hypothetical protein [Chloroflexota bacterium]
MALSQRDRRAILVGGVGLCLVLLYLFVIEPAALAYADLVAEHERLAGKVARAIYTQKKNAYLAPICRSCLRALCPMGLASHTSTVMGTIPANTAP